MSSAKNMTKHGEISQHRHISTTAQLMATHNSRISLKKLSMRTQKELIYNNIQVGFGKPREVYLALYWGL